MSLKSSSLIQLMRATHEKGAGFRFKAKGFSMSPFIRDGDVLTVAKCSNSLTVGELAAFVRLDCQKLVVHRVVGTKDSCYIFKGDNVFSEDGIVSSGNILGRVTRVERDGMDANFGVTNSCRFIALLSRYKLLPILLFLPRIFVRFRRSLNNE